MCVFVLLISQPHNLILSCAVVVCDRNEQFDFSDWHLEILQHFWKFIDPLDSGTAPRAAFEATCSLLRVRCAPADVAALYKQCSEHTLATFGQRVLELKVAERGRFSA